MAWSPYQNAIFADFQSGVGHSVVVACAGSGKTTTILAGLNHLPSDARVLFCAFGRDIARELRERAPPHVDVKTLHVVGLDAINRNPFYRRARIEDKKDMRLAQAVVANTNWEKMEPDAANIICKAASLAKNLLVTSREQLVEMVKKFHLDTDNFPADEIAALTAAAVRAAIDDRSQISFDDMIWLPVVLQMSVAQYDYVIIDELQDVCLPQLRLGQAACAATGRVIGVGDPRQAIYGFRGADTDAVTRTVEELKAKVLPLSVCYRCAKNIVYEAQAFVPEIEAAPDAPDGEVVSADLRDMLLNVKPGDFILSRANAPLSGLCYELVRNKMPARILGRSDVTAGLERLIRKSKANDAKSMCKWLEAFREKERKRLETRPETFNAVEDMIDTLLGFAEDGDSVRTVQSRINQLFVDKLNQDTSITLATTHRAKGKERNRVFLLEETYLRRPGIEEHNLMYVAITRAKRSLMYVNGLFEQKTPERSRSARSSMEQIPLL